VNEAKHPVEQLLDVLVYAPLGFASEARQLVPRLAEKGRQQLDVQVRVARMVGQFAVQKGQEEAAKLIGRLREPAPAPAPAPTDPAAGPVAGSAAAPAPTPAEEHIPVRVLHDEVVRAADLAIPSYDELAASQVVPRLEGLRPAELDAVRRYEAAHRGRKTILGKVAQLQRERAND
jgi:hypothetical protein